MSTFEETLLRLLCFTMFSVQFVCLQNNDWANFHKTWKGVAWKKE